jgi:hypothetical protein
MDEKPSLRLLINRQAYLRRAIRQHRLRFPTSGLRRKVVTWHILTTINFFGFFASLPWSIH